MAEFTSSDGALTLITLDEIRAAAAALPDLMVRTVLHPSEELSAIAGAPVLFKPECLQITGSYKARAAFTILNRLPADQRIRGAALSSSGNFAGAWARMGALLGIPVTVVMQASTSSFKVDRTRRYGAEVVLSEDSFDARWRTLYELESSRGLRVINTFEEPDVIRGHGTIGLEMAEELPEVETVLVPASSGGLLAGVACAVKTLCPKARVIGVQPTGSTAVHTSFHRGAVTRIDEVRTICDALIAMKPGDLPFAHIQRYVDDVVLVPEAAVRRAIRWLAEHAKFVVEAGGAVGAAALLEGVVKPHGRTIVLLSGGNIHPATLAEYLRTDD